MLPYSKDRRFEDRDTMGYNGTDGLSPRRSIMQNFDRDEESHGKIRMPKMSLMHGQGIKPGFPVSESLQHPSNQPLTAGHRKCLLVLILQLGGDEKCKSVMLLVDDDSSAMYGLSVKRRAAWKGKTGSEWKRSHTCRPNTPSNPPPQQYI